MSTRNPSATFLEEAHELLSEVEAGVLELESRPDDAELINRLFRAFHTIKGSGAMFGFDATAAFTHHVETVLQRVRDGQLAFDSGLATLVLAAKDHIQALLATQTSGTRADAAEGQRLAVALEALCGEDERSNGAPAVVRATPVANVPTTSAPSIAYRIFFRPNAEVFAVGMDPAAVLADLTALGECEITCVTDKLPALEALAPDRCHLAWEVLLTTDQGENAIRDAFIFVEDGSEIRIERSDERAAPVAPTALVHVPKAAPTSISVDPRDAVRSEPGKQRASANHATVRVPSDRLDRLVHLVGELVINQSRLTEASGRSNASELTGPVEAMERLINELRDSVLGIRMMPIGSTFSRFQRLVRDLSSELGKQIDLVTEGAETGLDKTMIDQLADPLVHLIRNSIDHGIEPAAERTARGKAGRGTIRLTAIHEGGHVVITVEDDGRGLDRAAIRESAERKGLIGANAALSERETFDLIFLPGFSTASSVTKVSGRGVGMDVVKRTIEGLRGSISLSSVLGRGTTTRLTLPLTLAIIDGLLVEVARDRFIIPMSAVLENVELTRRERQANNGRNLITVRGELVPYIRMRDLFGLMGPAPELEKVVVVAWDGRRLGLVVDRVAGSHQTVIQSLGIFFHAADLFSGTTIMGDGRVALILDLAGIARSAGRSAVAVAPVRAHPSKDLVSCN